MNSNIVGNLLSIEHTGAFLLKNIEEPNYVVCRPQYFYGTVFVDIVCVSVSIGYLEIYAYGFHLAVS
jgi:hypothetical protein